MKTKPKTQTRKPSGVKRKPKPRTAKLPADLFSTFALAHELEVNRHTLMKYLRGEEPDAMDGAAKLWSLARVRKILSERSTALNRDEMTPTQNKTQLECKRISLQADKIEMELKKARRELTDTAAFVEALNGLLGTIDQMLQRKLEMEFPKLCAGLPLKEIRTRGKSLRDAIRAEMDKELQKYNTPEYDY